MQVKLMLGDCLDRLKELEDNSVDSVVCDPPYGLSFMGKKWDYDVPSQEIWEECIRVLKPGGHLLSFGGSRTYHRMAVRIEDAGFEIRDQIMWVYGSGFPKSHNIGKSIDKKEGNEREVVGKNVSIQIREKGLNVNKEYGQSDGMFGARGHNIDVTKGNSPYEGWGTALKPAHEPIVMARKPFSGTVADNVLEWGTGGINIDGCRVGNESRTIPVHSDDTKEDTTLFGLHPTIQHERVETTEGRFPANIIFDEEAGKILDEQSGERKGFASQNCNNQKLYGGNSLNKSATTRDGFKDGYNDTGGASRFFYCPKASKKDRNEGCDKLEEKQRPAQTDKGNYSASPYCKDCGKTHNGTNDHSNCSYGVEYRPSTTTTKNNHPTIKPTDLMLYLIRLVTPKEGTTLDPFMGSGSTGKAAIRGGFKFFGIERESEYFDIAQARLDYEVEKLKSAQTKLDI